MESNPLRIVKLEASNVKRLTAVAIEPDGAVVVIGGKNGAGKSSVLDSIAYALGGKELLCERPLRAGAEKGHVEVDLGDLVVRRTFTAAGGGTLTVGNKDGAVYKSPQALLDRLVGRLSFDPLEFARMDPRAQTDALRALVGLDFAEIDRQRAGFYEERTAVNRAAAQLKARLAAMPKHDAPAEEVSVSDLVAELEAAEATRRAAEDAEEHAEGCARGVAAYEAAVAAAEKRLAELEREIHSTRIVLDRERAGLAAERESERKAGAAAKAAAKAIVDPAPIRARIAEADGINRKVRANVEREACAADLEATTAEAERLSREIATLDAAKANALAATKFPVEGLSFDAGGVLFNGIPFAQASSAEQIRVSVAMGLAMNPRLRVLLIRDGSLLDDDAMRTLAEMAEAAGAQVWLERVGDGAECQVVIEDGHVRGEAPAVESDERQASLV